MVIVDTSGVEPRSAALRECCLLRAPNTSIVSAFPDSGCKIKMLGRINLCRRQLAARSSGVNNSARMSRQVIDPILITDPQRWRVIDDEVELLARWMDNVFDIPG